MFDESAIAIIGLSCRFPDAHNATQFWDNLSAGKESISRFEDDTIRASGIPDALREKDNYVKAGGVLEEIDQFDARFFDFSPKEAELLDPQQRLFLEQAWFALENAGYNPDSYSGLIGVYAGAGMNTYVHNNLHQADMLLEPGRGYPLMIANDKDFLATRVSYKLNLKGPSLTLQTACSTSLVAVHLACQSIRSGECQMALAGGVSVRVPHKVGYLHQEGMILSPDGHCRAFDADAQGTVLGNGAGIVVLKLLEDAIADNDTVLAVIRGSAINNDGSLKAGYTAPSADAQAAVIQEALGVADVDASSISYVEAHGTGTAVGDPIEMMGLTKAYRTHTETSQFCALGSVKTNIGHLDAAAGVAGLIKTVLALHHEQLPPSLNYSAPNPRIDFANSPFYVNDTLKTWERNGTPRRAGVSSFGIGGTNAHLIVEESPTQPIEKRGERSHYLLPFSAKTASAVKVMGDNLCEALQTGDVDVADVAHTLQTGRKTFAQRQFLICQSKDEAIQKLNDGMVFGRNQTHSNRPVAFLFSGQGAQYVNMGRDLYEEEPVFRAEIDRCVEILRPHLGVDLRTLLYPDEKDVTEAEQQLKQTAITQPALFTIEYALTQLWATWGVRPQAMIGHSIGEYVAAHLAGVFSLEDALYVVSQRGKLMQALPPGDMLSVSLGEEALRPYLKEGISLATINTPTLCAVSGQPTLIAELQETLSEQGITCRALHTSHAFHSEMMTPMLTPFIELLGKIEMNAPQRPYISNVTGDWITTEEATDPVYWATHLRQAVRFADGVAHLLKNHEMTLLEVGPGRTLSTFATKHPERNTAQTVLSSLRHPKQSDHDSAFVLATVGKLWLAGVDVDWDGLQEEGQTKRVVLPNYPFERQRYWVEPSPVQHNLAAASSAEETKPRDLGDWFYHPSWQRVAPVKPAAQLATEWLIFLDTHGLGSQLAERIRNLGQTAVTVAIGEQFAQIDEQTFVIDPGNAADYKAVLSHLTNSLQKIVHLGNLSEMADEQMSLHSLIYLAQALGEGAAEPIDLIAVTTHAQSVLGDETIIPEKALLSGPIQTIPHEYPHIISRTADVVLHDGVIDQIWTEIQAKTEHNVVAYRGTHRWIQTYEPIYLDAPDKPLSRLRERGTYLITGGMGGIGLVLAQHLAETAQARLVLIGRSAFPAKDERQTWLETHGENDAVSRKIRQVEAMEAAGSDVLVVAADCADYDQMEAAITQATTQFGSLHGVIHAAGVAGGGLMQQRTPEQIAAVLAPKVEGSRILGQLCDEMSLDFMLFCSSINAVISRVGQADYCAANAFLDAFVLTQKKQGAVSVNWDNWQEVGMAADAVQSLYGEQIGSLVDRCIHADVDRPIFVTHLHSDLNWELHDHHIMGQPTLPGTAYLEIATAAFQHQTGTSGSVEIRNATFTTPLVIQEGHSKSLYTTLKRDGEAFEFVVQTELTEGMWQEHARGVVAPLTIVATERSAATPIETIEARCPKRVDNPLQADTFGDFQIASQGDTMRVITNQDKSLSIGLGARWHTVESVKLGQDEGVAHLKLAADVANDCATYQLHPALLDFAVGFLRLFKNQASYLPFSYKNLRSYQPIPAELYSHIQYMPNSQVATGMPTFHVRLLDTAGELVAEIEEFCVMRVNAQQFSAIADHAAAGSTWDKEMVLADGIKPADGVALFERVLNSVHPHLITSTQSLSARQSAPPPQLFANQAVLGRLRATQAKYPRPQLMTPYAAPRSETEQQIATIWQDVLAIQQVGIHDDFFELGGNSLIITQIHSQIQEAFETELSVANLLQYPTISAVATAMNQPIDTGVPLQDVQARGKKQKEALKRNKALKQKRRRR